MKLQSIYSEVIVKGKSYWLVNKGQQLKHINIHKFFIGYAEV